MQSFDTKDSNKLENFDRKFESFGTFGTKDSEVKQSDNDFVESFDRKFEGFDMKDSEMEQSDSEFVESFDQKYESIHEHIDLKNHDIDRLCYQHRSMEEIF